MEPRCALTIAGSDSGGGAGIQADLRTFSAFGLHATTALTAVTAQNTRTVRAVVPLRPADVVAQVDAVLEDFPIRAVKTGMLTEPGIVWAVARLAEQGRLPHLVVDPVLVSSTGSLLLADGGIEAYRDALIPQAELITPNLPEAAALAGVDGRELGDVASLVAVAHALQRLGARAVLVKGGHVTSPGAAAHSPDVLLFADEVVVLEAERVATVNDHGTGCSLSAAIAAGLALDRSLPDAVRDAKAFVLAALRGAAPWHLGGGHGPIDHFGWGM
ncbi:MAG: bifunctional hydroxymethylpyrimidine kinase/phosphomethylpyrimidine kinase [Acidimicrobiales bacterium]